MVKEEVIKGVSHWVSWWIESRQKKLRDQLSETMSVNPFLLPILFDLHDLENFEELSEFIVGSHLMTGHNTGFGKLIDEKILPNVFGTVKLDKSFRNSTPPYSQSKFNEIDHIVPRGDDLPDLLSLKAGRWTIQLTMAKQLNTAFHEILESYPESYGEIVVGVFYGSAASLTDKYDILRGINRGASHDVVDLTDRVSVYAGRDFWSWLNERKSATQDWVLDGILHGVRASNPRSETGKLLSAYKASIARQYEKYSRADGSVDWHRLLSDING